MRKLAILFCILLLSIGLSKDLAGHTIIVTLDRGGNAHVTEKYTMQLNLTEYLDFERIAKSTNTDLDMWRAFFSDITTTAKGNLTTVTTSASTAGAGNFGNDVLLTYDIPNFAKEISKIGRDVTYEVTDKEFTFYQQDIGKFILPWKTELQIKFIPIIQKNSVVEAMPSPTQTAMVDNEYTLFWRGSRIDSSFSVKYRVEENVGAFDAMTVANSIYLFFYETPVYSLAAVIVLVLFIIYRKPVIEIISESFGGEEEIELPKRGV